MNTTDLLARLRLVLPAVLLVLVAACGGGDQDQGAAGRDAGAADAPAAASSDDASADTAHAASPGGATTVAGVAFTPPDGWTDLGATRMRKAQYQHPPVEGDQEPAEVNVFYFGAQGGGGVEANLQRWIRQMRLPDGGDPAAAAERDTLTAGGMTGHVVRLDGTYAPGAMAGGDGEPRPGYRLVGVVLEGPRGSVFFKLTGPRATAAAMEKGLMDMIAGARPQG